MKLALNKLKLTRKFTSKGSYILIYLLVGIIFFINLIIFFKANSENAKIMAPMFSLLLIFLFRDSARTFRLKNIDEVNIDNEGLEIITVNYLLKAENTFFPLRELVSVDFKEVPFRSKGLLIKFRDSADVYIEIESASSDKYSVIPRFTSDYFLTIDNKDITENIIQEIHEFINKAKS